MANTLLTPTIITREALRILHQEMHFISSINRQYDDRFANSGASPSGKIGPNLAIRMPNRFTVRSGAILDVQDVSEESQTLTVSTQKGVDFKFPSVDLTLTIDAYGERYLRPAMSVLASIIEDDAISMYKDVHNIVDGDAAAFDFVHLTTAQEVLNDELSPRNMRYALLKNKHVNKFLVATKGLFNPQSEIGGQYRRGVLGNIADFDVMASSHLTNHTTGSAAKTTAYLTDIAGGEDNGSAGSLHIDTGTTTFLKGDIVTVADVNRVHPETKANTGVLQKFVVTADFAGGGEGDLKISPSIIATGPKQNVNAAAVDGKAIVKVGAGADELLDMSIAYHRDAFTFVSADLEDVSKYGAWGARQVMDGISMRIARQYDIVNDQVPCRIDVLYGFKTIRPELACRIHADG